MCRPKILLSKLRKMIFLLIIEGDTPLLVRSIQGDLDGTQYAKGRYAVRRNSVISYADINFYFKMVQFSSKNTTHMTYKVK